MVYRYSSGNSITGYAAYYGLGIISGSDWSTGKEYLYRRNAHGDVVMLAEKTASTYQRRSLYECDAFGTPEYYSSTDPNSFLYAGQFYDRESESYYLRARNYLPGYGRFSQPDTHWNTENMIYGDNPTTHNDKQTPNYEAISQSFNLYNYCVDNPVQYVDLNGEIVATAGVTFAIRAILFGIGLFASAKIGVGIGSEVARQHRNSFENSAVTQQSLDSYASKEEGNRQHHILHGSRRSREQHAPIWRKFNIDPDGGNGWEKLLPLLNEVKEFGEKRSEVEQNGEKVVTYAREYVEKGVEIIVKIFVNTDGKATISDAWGEYLY